MATDRSRYPIREPKNKMFYAIWLFGGPEDRGRELVAQLAHAGFYVERHVPWGATKRVQGAHVPAYLDAVVFLSTMMSHAECKLMRDKCTAVDVPVVFTVHKYTHVIAALRFRGLPARYDVEISPEKFKEWKRSKDIKRADVEILAPLAPIAEPLEVKEVVEVQVPVLTKQEVTIPQLSFDGPRELGILTTFRQLHEYMKQVGIRMLLANATEIEVQLEEGSLKWQRTT